MQCAKYLARAISLNPRPPAGSPFLPVLFPISPDGPLFFLFPPFALVLANFRFLADPANLCITSPAIRRANKYHRDNILIDL